MDISSLTNISSDYLNQIAQQNRLVTTDDDSFSSVLSSAMNMVSETNEQRTVGGDPFCIGTVREHT